MTDLWPQSAPSRIDLAEEPEFDLGGMRVRPAECAVELGSQREVLQPRVMQVLVALAKARPRIVSRDKIIDLCWEGRIVGDDAVNRCILALRHLAREFNPPPFSIETAPRVGHRLVEADPAAEVPQKTAALKMPWRLLSAVLISAIVAVALLVARPWIMVPRTPTVVVTAASPDPQTRELAADLKLKLVSLDNGRPTATRLIDEEQGSHEPPDLILEVRRTIDPAVVGASVAVKLSPDHSILWSKELSQPSRNTADLKRQVALSAAYVLRCAADGLAAAEPLNEVNLKTYVSACAAMSDHIDDPRSMVRTLRGLVERAQRFVPAWALLLQAEAAAADGLDPRERTAFISALKRDLIAARKIEPNLAEAFLVEGFLTRESDFAGRGRLLDDAVRHNPDHALSRVLRSDFLQSVGRSHDALVDAREAIRLDPLSSTPRGSYVTMLAIVGRKDAALEELRAVEQLWPGTRDVQELRGFFHLRWGDPREALRMHLSETSPRKTARVLEPYLRARIDPTEENIERALRHGRMIFRERPGSIQLYSQLLAEFEHNDELFEVLINWQHMDMVTAITSGLFRPAFANFHREPRFMRVAKHLGLVNYWQTTGEWPDFCYALDLPYDCKAEAAKLAAAA